MQRYWTLLKARRQFRLLWLAQVISLTGDWFNTIASVILVNRYMDSELAISFLFLGRALPVFIFSPIAGVIADRFDRKWILIISNALRIFVVLGFLLVDSRERAPLIFILTLTQFSISAFFEPAYNAIIPRLVSSDELITANTLGNVTWSVMLTFGAVIGGVVAGVAGVQVALIVDALTFALAASLIFFMQVDARPTQVITGEALSQDAGRFADLREGFSYVMTRPALALVAMVKGLGQFGSIDLMVAVYAEKIFRYGNDGSTTLGILFAAHGVGAILGPLLGDFLGDGSERSLQRWIGLGFGMVVLGWVVYALGGSLAVVAGGMVIRGMGGSINWVYSSILIQMKVPDSHLGRVFGLDFTFFMLMLSLSVLIPGWGMDILNIPPREMVLILSALSLLPVVLWLVKLRTQGFLRPASP